MICLSKVGFFFSLQLSRLISLLTHFLLLLWFLIFTFFIFFLIENVFGLICTMLKPTK